MRWLREPVVHFVAAGVALFLLDAALSDAPAEAPLPSTDSAQPSTAIRVTPAVVAELRTAMQAELQRDPTDEELEAQIGAWTTDEALRREAIRLGLDDNDPIIQRRLVQNMRFVLEAAEPPPEPDDAAIDAWLAVHLPDAEARARVDFTHVFFDGGRREDPVADARAARPGLDAGDDPSGLGDPFIRGRTFRTVGRPEIARLLGNDAATAILALEPGRWSDPVLSPYGAHLVRVEERHVPPAGGTDAERDAARRAIVRDVTREAEEAAIRAVVDRYAIVRDDRAGAEPAEAP